MIGPTRNERFLVFVVCIAVGEWVQSERATAVDNVRTSNAATLHIATAVILHHK